MMDAHVVAFRCSERWRYVCECRHVVRSMNQVERDAYLAGVTKVRGGVAGAKLRRGVEYLLDRVASKRG